MARTEKDSGNFYCSGSIGYLKKLSKALKKKSPYISLMHIQHDLAKFLGFNKWTEMIEMKESLIQSKIELKIPFDTFSETSNFLFRALDLKSENSWQESQQKSFDKAAENL